jgi:voltage-gated potassium channel
VAVYAVVPVAGRSGASVVIRLVVGVLVFVAVVGWQLCSVSQADQPQLRAAEALTVAFVLLVLGFAYTYLSLSRGSSQNFSEHLNHIGAVYFALTIITTVGFGDISPRTNASRLVVSVQFILDLIFVFGIVRVYFGTARLSRRGRGLPTVDES